MSATETIYARATPPGKSGVAVVRLSGPRALSTALQLSGRTGLTPRLSTLCTLVNHATQQIIDHALVIFFAAPHSFTGEDVVEFHTHGSRAVLQHLWQAFQHTPGLRPAEAGEFTRRAFANGKMDLTRVEGLADLIEAETSIQASQALRQMSGQLEQRYAYWREQLITILALLEAYIDFPDEEIPEGVQNEALHIAQELYSNILSHLADNRGKRLREGAIAVILGEPNVGKSSILNYLANHEVAIVSDIPGTTRDALEVHMDIAGYPLTLIDTAGLRETNDMVEHIGIERSRKHAAHADLRLIVLEANTTPSNETKQLINSDALVVFNKSDKHRPDKSTISQYPNAISISAKTGEGMPALLHTLEQRCEALMHPAQDANFTRERHRTALQHCKESLERFTWNMSNAPLELSVEELRNAANALGRITGAIGVEEVLDAIFTRFCLGK